MSKEYELITVSVPQYNEDGTPLMVNQEVAVTGEDGVLRYETRQVHLHIDTQKAVKIEPPAEPKPKVMAMAMPTPFSTPTQKSNTFVFKQDFFLVNGIKHYCLDGELEVLYPEAPAGYETYDSSDGSYINHLTAKSDKYPDAGGNPTDAGGDVNEAVSRAFEGLLTNGDFRKDSSGWAHSNHSDGGTITIANGELHYKGGSQNGYMDCSQLFDFVAGTEYIFEFYLEFISGDGLQIFSNEQSQPYIVKGLTTTGYHKISYTADTTTSSTLRISRWADGGGVAGEFKFKYFSARPKTEQVIVSRQDLSFVETWQERSDDKGKAIVFPLGWVQYPKSTWEGITLTKVTDVVVSTDEQGVETKIGAGYCKWGDWQADEDAVGYCAVWDDLTLSQKKQFLSDPKNNLYVNEDGELVQDRWRGKTVKGFGNDWQNPVNYFLADSGVGLYDEICYRNNYSSVKPRGKLDIDTETLRDLGTDHVNVSYDKLNTYKVGWFTPDGYNGSKYTNHKDDQDSMRYTVPCPDKHSSFEKKFYSENDLCCLLPLALTQRLNQGAYSPLNPMGCRAITVSGGNADWYSSSIVNFNCLKHHFITESPAMTVTNSRAADWTGYISSTSGNPTGRPDSDPYKYYDAISEGQVLDLRLNSNKQDINRLREDAIRQAVAGEMRGWENLPITWLGKLRIFSKPVFDNGYTKFIHATTKSFVERKGTNAYYNADIHESIFKAYIKSPVSGNWYRMSHTTTTSDLSVGSQGTNYIHKSHGNVQNDFNVTEQTDCDVIITTYDVTTEKFNTLPMCDIVGDPTNIKATMDALGVDKLVGSWIPNDYVTANVTTHSLTRKFSTDSTNYVYTLNNGGSWGGGGNVGNSSTTNTVSFDHKVGQTTFVSYSSLSNFTEAASNTAIVGEFGDVSASFHHQVDVGNRLQSSLVGSIATDYLSPDKISANRVPLSSVGFYAEKLWFNSAAGSTTHGNLQLASPSSSDVGNGFKALNTLVEKNGLLYLQLNGCELKHNGTSWGDDQIIPIVSNESTKTDLNGTTVKTFCHHSLIPLGISYKD